MQTRMRSFVQIALVALAFPHGLNGALISLTPSAPSVSIGSIFTLEAKVFGLVEGSAPSLAVLDLLLEFDPSLLAVQGLRWGNGLDILGLGSLRATSTGSGFISIFELSLDRQEDLDLLQPDSFLLFALDFLALNAGTSNLDITQGTMGDAIGDPIYTVFQNSTVSVGLAVPEPTPTIQVLGGLAFAITLSATRSRKRNRDSE